MHLSFRAKGFALMARFPLVLCWKHKSLLGAVALAFSGMTAPAALAGDDLTLLEWAGYDDQGLHKTYLDKYGASPKYSFFVDEEEAFQKVRSGFKADMMHPCAQTLPKWEDAGLYKPIDTSRLKNWDKLLPMFREVPGAQKDGKVWFVPADWGNTGLNYLIDTVPEADVQSLQVFVDPKYKGKVTIGDNVDDAFGLGLLATGTKAWANVTEEQVDKAAAWLRLAHKNVRFYWTDYSALVQSMASKEVLISWSWNDTATKLAEAGVKARMNRDAKEGAITFVCGFSMLKDAPGSEDKAYDYINAWLEDQSATYILTTWGYGHANTGAFQGVDAAKLQEKGFANVDAMLAKTLFQAGTNQKMHDKMIAEFEKIKAGY
jgi:spermidine/putrescine transport system substrate-binding protein